MLGAITGDIVGSIYEAAPIKTKDFPLFGPDATFTDDTVCTVAIADSMMGDRDFAGSLRSWVQAHPGRGYGGMFLQWALTPGMGPYGSWGNGAAMRVSAIAHLAGDETEALELAARTAAVSHDHPDAVAGAQAVVLAMWLARRGRDPTTIRATIESRFAYDLGHTVDQIRPGYAFDVSCKGTVPPALVAALEARDYENAVRNAVSLGGDSDTLACITGGLAEVLHGLPAYIAGEARRRLTPDLLAVLDRLDRALQARERG
jgi:ADP-ribosylglycohydrolase